MVCNQIYIRTAVLISKSEAGTEFKGFETIIQLAIMVEGQRGMTWERLQRFASAVSDLGYDGLYRSDHFVDAEPPDQESLDLWTSLTWIADHTERIEFGSLVTPFSFRHPVHVARMARDIDDLSGGRFVLGVGAGWGGAEREHIIFGFDLLDVPERFQRFEEGLIVITQLLRSNRPVTFRGKYYQLQEAVLLPRPRRKGGPPILIGGNGPKRVLPLAAKYADEWNSIYRTEAQFKALNERFDQLLQVEGREPNSVKRSQMKGVLFGVNQQDLNEKLDGKSVEYWLERGLLVGTGSQIVDQLFQLQELGCDKVMVHWHSLEDIVGLERFANSVIPQLKN